jgi:hypothetical protein
MKWFGRFLLAGWSFFVLFVIAGFNFPKVMSRLFGWSAQFIILIPMSLLLGTAVFVVMLLYRAGMRRVTE